MIENEILTKESAEEILMNLAEIKQRQLSLINEYLHLCEENKKLQEMREEIQHILKNIDEDDLFNGPDSTRIIVDQIDKIVNPRGCCRD